VEARSSECVRAYRTRSAIGRYTTARTPRERFGTKQKRKLTAAEKAAKKRRRSEYMTIFICGKQKRVRRPPTIEGLDVDEFIRRNADPMWLHQNEMWEYMDLPGQADGDDVDLKPVSRNSLDEALPLEDDGDDEIPF
jgi:hypothetical protein